MKLIETLTILVPAIFGGWFFGSGLAIILDLGEVAKITTMLIFGVLLWLTLMFT